MAKGLAWSVPIVLVGAPAPAFAVSGCPPLSMAIDSSNLAYDELRVTNSGGSGTTLPVGTTITWLVQNRSGGNATLRVTAVSGVSAAPTILRLAANGGTGTITFTLTAPLPPGSSLSWRYTITNWNYASLVTVTGCPGPGTCLSSIGTSPGTDCPTVAGARAQRVGPILADYPDPLDIPPKLPR